MNLYLNGHLVNSTNLVLSRIAQHTSQDNLGSSGSDIIMNTILYLKNNFYFQGLIDEVKFYNPTLTDQELEQNYYNYKGYAKGCCNYLNLVNPTKLGYNSSIYDNNISYNNKIFYDYFKRGGNLTPNKYDFSVYNFTNFTSLNPNLNYYNFKVDVCMLQAYSIQAWNGTGLIKFGRYNSSCANMIRAGLY